MKEKRFNKPNSFAAVALAFILGACVVDDVEDDLGRRRPVPAPCAEIRARGDHHHVVVLARVGELERDAAALGVIREPATVRRRAEITAVGGVADLHRVVCRSGPFP